MPPLGFAPAAVASSLSTQRAPAGVSLANISLLTIPRFGYDFTGFCVCRTPKSSSLRTARGAQLEQARSNLIPLDKFTEQGASCPPAFSDEAVALRFAERHADDLRFVAAWASGFRGPERTGISMIP